MAQRHISAGKHFFRAFNPWWVTILLVNGRFVIKKEKTQERERDKSSV